MNPLKTQIGGDHYKVMAIQPIEFAAANEYDPAAFSIFKYLCRFRRKGEGEDLKKALHFIEIREKLMAEGYCWKPDTKASIQGFCDANKISGKDALTLAVFDLWLKTPFEDKSYRPVVWALTTRIEMTMLDFASKKENSK